ncbi:hypothetical protein LTS10_012155 [Elasticomyces elasticus]|nr:hypothetical protein LTS10_012155 [Elasticomyces elasticus]
MTLNTLFTTALALTVTLSSIAQAHLIISSPVPYGKDSLDNSPLIDAKPGTSGSNFPCKLRTGGYDITTENHITAGEDQTLSFIGSASHGGGTCQLALSSSRTPDHTSEWKAFQIYEGGCPVNGDGNDGTSNFTYTVPTGIKNGEYSLAWTWYNRVGNRELYMNCAPVTVTGGSESSDFYDSLPNTYVINQPTSECSSVESSNQLIPNPGNAAIEKDTTYSAAAASGPSCAASAAAMTQGVSGGSGGQASSATAASATAPASSVAGGYSASSPSAITSALASSSPNGGQMGNSAYGSASFLTISTAAASSPAESSAYPTMAPSSAGIAAPTGYPAAATGSSSDGASTGSSTGSSGSDAITCSPDGKKFGQEVGGSTVWRAVSAGTTCSNGAIVKRRSLARHPHARRAGHV